MTKFKFKRSLVCLIPALMLSAASFAGEKGKDSEEEIQWEISYLAKRMLDLKGSDSYVVEREAIDKPFIGICADMKKPGVAITCVTPDSQASKSGLKTGDLIVSINDISMAEQVSYPKMGEKGKGKPSYWSIVSSMKVGDSLDFELLRAGEPMNIKVTVGVLRHPAYRLEINK